MECTECKQSFTDSSQHRVKRDLKLLCSPCWAAHVKPRFRKKLFELLDKSRTKKLTNSNTDSNRETFAIFYDGSDSSKALLQLIKHSSLGHGDYNSGSKAPPYPLNFVVLFIFQDFTEDEVNKLLELRAWLRKELAMTDPSSRSLFLPHLPLIVSSLELALKLRTNQSSFNEHDQEISPELYKRFVELDFEKESDEIISLAQKGLDEDLRGILTSLIAKGFKSQSTLEDFLRILRSNLMVSIAGDLGLSGVLIPENQTTLAIKMFTFMSLGRGEEIARQMGLWTQMGRSGELKIARPLLDFSEDDLREYLVALRGDTCAVKSLDDHTGGSNELMTRSSSGETGKKRVHTNPSIGSHCSEFIGGLSRDFPSTVSTLSRIGLKLEGNSQGKSVVVFPPPSVIPSLDHVSSRMMSDGSGEVEEKVEEKCNFCSFCQQAYSQLSPELSLCHGCTNIQRDSVNPASFLRQVLHQDLA